MELWMEFQAKAGTHLADPDPPTFRDTLFRVCPDSSNSYIIYTQQQWDDMKDLFVSNFSYLTSGRCLFW